MDDIPLSDYLEADPRPTCVVDLGLVSSRGQCRSSVVFKNKALRARPQLLSSLAGCAADGAISHHLPEWCHDRHFAGPVPLKNGKSLHTHVVEGRWRLVQWTRVTKRRRKGKPLVSRDTRDIAAKKLHNLHRMMDNVDIGIFEYNRRGTLVWGNDAFYHLSGHPRVGSEKDNTWRDCVFEEDDEWLLGQWRRMASGEPITIEMKWKRPASAMPNGEEDTTGQWVLATCQPTFDSAGAVTSVYGCLTDIAAQKRAETDDPVLKAETLERLVASKRFSNFVELARVGIFMVNLEEEMQYANPEFCALLAHRDTPLRDIKWHKYLDEENLAVARHHLGEMVRTKQPAQYQLNLLRLWENDQGAVLPVRLVVACIPEMDEDGTVVGLAGTIIDITHLRWAEQLQKQRTDEAIEAKRQQENFIDLTCHEIRNPLGAVVHCVDAMRSLLEDMRELARAAMPEASQFAEYNALFASTSESIEILTTCCAHQKRIVDDILTMSKLDSKLLTVAPARMKLDDLLLQTYSLFEADARKDDVLLRTIRQPSLDELIAGQDVVADSGRLLQVLVNLITNALKFTRREPKERIVTVAAGASRDRPSEQALGVQFLPAAVAIDRQSKIDQGKKALFLHFQVTDTGCGIGSEEKLRIFERFEQASVRTHSRYGGSGLGLFISREMVESHGGEIGVSSQPGQGATFAFYIAAHASEPQLATASKPTDLTPRPKQKNSASTPQRPYSILVVEDNLINQKVLRNQLQKLGHTVHVASHGAEALSFLATTSLWAANSASSPPDVSVILMDIEMPVMGGLECTRRIRQSEADGELNRHVPIIAVSANARGAQVSEALDCGMDNAIAKPFRVADLMPKIEALVT